LTDDVSRPFRVLFVCSGNTCRSPLAQLLFRILAEEEGLEGVEALSAGTLADPGSPASPGALAAAHRHGFSLRSHRSVQLSPQLLEQVHMVLTMGPGHLEAVKAMGAGEKAALLGAFSRGADPGSAEGGDARYSVPDPFGGDAAIYEETYDTLAALLRDTVRRLGKVEEQ